MTQPCLFEQSGDYLKLRGMRVAAEERICLLIAAKVRAVVVARNLGRPITIDDVFASFEDGVGVLTPAMLGNAAGSVFKGPEWEFVAFVKSTRPSNHSRMVRSWRLK